MFNSSKKKGNWQKEVKADDSFVGEPNPGDLVIPIMGPTGVGKSTFINTLLGSDLAIVGHDLQSETAYIQHYFVPDSTRRIIVVDTPGFDDTNIEDREILRRIAVWLAHSYDADMKLAGIIYLHEITQSRMLGAARRNLDMFQKLCGKDATRNVILATTKWSEISPELGERREKQLRGEHWQDMLLLGSRMRRFESTQTSARYIIDDILARNAVDPTLIQFELVRIDKFLAETEAGRTLRYTLVELLEAQKKAAEQLLKDDGDKTRNVILETDNKIRSLVGQIHGLSVPLSRKITSLLRF